MTINDRLEQLARRLAAEREDDPHVRAVLLVGSVARGTADRHSDLDMILYVDPPYSESELASELERAEASGGGFHGDAADTGFALYHIVDGVKCDMAFNLVRRTEALLDELLIEHSTDTTHQLIVDGIRTGLVLRGGSLIEGWRARTEPYPEGLARAMVEANLKLRPRWVLEGMAAERDERLWIVEELLTQIRLVCTLLFALNRVYHPGKLKGTRPHLEGLATAPERLADRLEALLSSEPSVAAADCSRLVDETLALVAKHMPDVDLQPAYDRLALRLDNGLLDD